MTHCYSTKLGVDQYSPYIEPKFSPSGEYLAIDKNTFQVIEILDTSNYQPITTIDYSDYNIGRIDWLGNDLIASLTLDDNSLIWDRSTGFVVDSVGYDVTIWNEIGSQFIARGDQVDGRQASIAVFDRVTEAVITQVSSPVSIRSAAVTHTSTGDILEQLLGSAVINDLELTTVFDGVLQAFTYPDEIGSVTFTVNGVTTVDNTVPYTFPLPEPGMHTVTISSYTGQNAEGEKGLPFTVVLAINNPPVADADGDQLTYPRLCTSGSGSRKRSSIGSRSETPERTTRPVQIVLFAPRFADLPGVAPREPAN